MRATPINSPASAFHQKLPPLLLEPAPYRSPLIGLSNASTIAEEIVAKNYSARKVEYLVKSKKKPINDKKYDANIIKAQERIEKKLGLKVYISNKKNNRGKITIEYKDLEQFELISKLLTKS